ncbi:hypothetical protein [Vescimonas sp.]
MRLQRATGKGRIFHDDLHAFSSGGILLVNNGALRKDVSPTAYFLPTAAKSMKKCRQKPMVSGLPLPSRGLLVMGPPRELTQQQTRSRSGEENISFTAGSTDSPGRTVSFFN